MANYFWQGGERVEFEQADSGITIEADDERTARVAAERAGVTLENLSQVAPGLVRAEVSADRDVGMKRLREDNVVHHVYRGVGQPANEFLITETFFVKFKPGTPRRSINQFLRDEGLESVDDMGNGVLLCRVTGTTGRNCIKAANNAAKRDDIEYAEPNLVRTLQKCAFLPADNFFPKQWHLHAPVDGPDLVAGAAIYAPEAWDLTRGVRSIVICVADDGFDLTHPDFQGDGKIAGKLNARAVGSTGVTFDDAVLPQPGDYHGTPCAGVALAEQNGQGTVGVAPGCAFLAMRFELNISDAQMIKVFERISTDADVVSCSWGVGPANAPMSTAFRDSLAQLARTGGRRGKGLVICVAAGNNNCPVKDLQNTATYEFLDRARIRRQYSGPINRWIAAHPDVITVSGCTSLKTRSCYSSWGREIAVCAPTDNWDDLGRFQPRGRGIVTTDNEGFGSGSDFTSNSRYTADFGGTSSATPTVAGVCGLVLSRNASLSASDVKHIVQETGDHDLLIESETDVNRPGDFVNGFSLWYGHGKVNALRAVTAALPQPDEFVDQSSVPQLDIPDTSDPIIDEIEVGSRGTIQEVRVAVDIQHTYIGDLRLDVIAPDGTAVTLHNHAGGSRHNLAHTYTADDVPALRAFQGKQIAGVWQLRVSDEWRMDVGKLRSWRIVAKVAVPVTPAQPPSNQTVRARPRNRRQLISG